MEWLKKDIHDEYSGALYDGCETDMELIDEISAVDITPVVQCEKCGHWDSDPDTYGTDDGPKGKCMKSFETTYVDDFCSYGELKEHLDGMA